MRGTRCLNISNYRLSIVHWVLIYIIYAKRLAFSVHPQRNIRQHANIWLVLKPSGQTDSLISTQVSASIGLAFRLTTHLRWLWSSSNSYASRRKFFTACHPTQVDKSWSRVNCICIKMYNFLRLASSFSRPSQVRTQFLVTNPRRLASSFGQRLKFD